MGASLENFFELSASMCDFNGGFMRLGPDFSRFGHKDISCAREKPNSGQNCFQTGLHVFVFFTFISSACFFDIISSMSPQVLAKYF